MTTDPPLWGPAVEHLTDELAALDQKFTDAVTDLDAQVTALVGPLPPPPRPPAWFRNWGNPGPKDTDDVKVKNRERQEARRVALRGWVNDLRHQFSLTDAFTPPACWEKHPGMVEEAWACYTAWCRATTASQGTLLGSTEYSVWLDRSLWPWLTRLDRYRSAYCNGEHRADEPPLNY